MLPFSKSKLSITVSPDEVMRNKRDIILGYYHETKHSLDALRMLVDRSIITPDRGFDYARPLLNKLDKYRDWLDNYTHNLRTLAEQELKDECDLNGLESTLGSAE